MTAEHLTVDSWDSETDGWCVLDYTPLKEPADQRGTDLLVPGAVGVVAYRRRNTVTQKSLPLHIYGATLSDGTAAADGQIGLQANIDDIREIVAPTGTGDGTRSAVWYLPDGSTRTARVHVLGLTLGRVAPDHVNAVLKLSFPDGGFAAGSS